MAAVKERGKGGKVEAKEWSGGDGVMEAVMLRSSPWKNNERWAVGVCCGLKVGLFC